METHRPSGHLAADPGDLSVEAGRVCAQSWRPIRLTLSGARNSQRRPPVTGRQQVEGPTTSRLPPTRALIEFGAPLQRAAAAAAAAAVASRAHLPAHPAARLSRDATGEALWAARVPLAR